jgi:hydroxymethylpyrimidine pyrophosphatase-like HAD family hydrolase
MRHCWLFDIDGVLCEPQQPMNQKMADALRALWLKGGLYFVTGNNYVKAIDLLGDIISLGSVFSNNADELRGYNGQLEWQDTETLHLPEVMNAHLYHWVRETHSNNNSVEWRSPRFVNFCPIGRYATQIQREDCNMSWRQDFIKSTRAEFLPQMVQAVIGGQTSVDVYSYGADKSRAGKWLNDNGYTFTFIGDKTDPGGNDYPLVKYCEEHPENRWFKTSGPAQTLEIIKSL